MPYYYMLGDIHIITHAKSRAKRRLRENRGVRVQRRNILYILNNTHCHFHIQNNIVHNNIISHTHYYTYYIILIAFIKNIFSYIHIQLATHD